jgi:hypothetical protein
MQLRGLVVASLCVLVACEPAPRGASPAVASVLDSFVVGPEIGARAAPVAAALHLPFAPYVGYADTGFHAARGVHGLLLQLDEALRSGDARPSRRARIRSIAMGFSTRAEADSARQLLTRHLGTPVCYFTGPESRRLALYFWPGQGPEGVMLTVPLNQVDYPFVVFGADQPDPGTSAPTACDTG